MQPSVPPARGAGSNPDNRFATQHIELEPDALVDNDGKQLPLRTQFLRDDSQSIILWNDSPDIPFRAGLNPYRGCEHGYARPTHEYRGYSAGLEFESRIMVKLRAAGVRVRAMVAPVLPGLNDHEIPAILTAARKAGARFASYILLRLPLAVAPIFSEWLDRHRPGEKEKILGRIRELRGGKLNVSEFKERMRGKGDAADQISRLFAVAKRRAGFTAADEPLSAEAFRVPTRQMSLFD